MGKRKCGGWSQKTTLKLKDYGEDYQEGAGNG